MNLDSIMRTVAELAESAKFLARVQKTHIAEEHGASCNCLQSDEDFLISENYDCYVETHVQRISEVLEFVASVGPLLLALREEDPPIPPTIWSQLWMTDQMPPCEDYPTRCITVNDGAHVDMKTLENAVFAVWMRNKGWPLLAKLRLLAKSSSE